MTREHAKQALVGTGWSAAVAKPAVAAAMATLGDAATLEEVIRAALQRARSYRDGNRPS